MAVLNCESHESSLKSISDAYGVNTTDLTEFLWKLDLDEEYRTKNFEETGDRNLVRMFQSQFGAPIQVWDTVYWFHLTRVPPNTDFAEGILPLHSALEKIWNAIIAVPRDLQKRANLEKLRDTGVPDHLYNFKTKNPIHCGPYAMLVRESAFHSRSMGNHDYLEFPEIVEDICNGYQQRYGERIHEEISKAFRRCIVKFEAPETDGASLVGPALFYCWYKAHNQKLSLSTNTCYDAKGTAIPQSAIRRVEFP